MLIIIAFTPEQGTYTSKLFFQQFNLFPHLTVLENITIAQTVVRKRNKVEATRIAHEQLEKVGIPEKAGAYPGQLSGGQQQRVSVARALASQPRFILADEPTANLDTENGEQVMEIMKKLNEETGTTFIFATHDPRVIKHAKRVVTLQDGLIISDNNNK